MTGYISDDKRKVPQTENYEKKRKTGTMEHTNVRIFSFKKLQ